MIRVTLRRPSGTVAVRCQAALVACVVFAMVFWPEPIHAQIPNGERCGNTDTCEPGDVCYFNTCISDIFQGEMPNGQGNECSVSDCCQSELRCFNIGAVLDDFGQVTGGAGGIPPPQDGENRATSICLKLTEEEAAGLPILQCGGQQPTDPTPTDPTPTDPTPTDPTPTDPTPTDPTPTDPTPTDPAPTDPSADSTGPNQGGSDDPNTPTPTDPTPTNPNPPTDGSCGNSAACPNGDYCLANRCVAVSIAGPLAINALGNTCSASDCCPLGLMCTSEGNRCAPAVPGIGSVTCAATGTQNSGVRVGPQGGGNNNGGDGGNQQGGNAAQSQQVAGGLVTMVVAAAVAAIMRAW